jgi:hypothetical protein
MIADEMNMDRKMIHLILTEELGMIKILSQDGAQESQKATAACAVGSRF